MIFLSKTITGILLAQKNASEKYEWSSSLGQSYSGPDLMGGGSRKLLRKLGQGQRWLR